MINPAELEEAFREFTTNPGKWAPDGVIPVDLTLLHELGLLENAKFDASSDDFTQYFHVTETADKVTLFNELFAVWIVPKNVGDSPSTLTYIALLKSKKPHLELVFSTTGVYNTPKHILKILRHFLAEVQDTEAVIASIGKKS
jgi:hypothetical protein